jgi:hypothetical protein
LSGNCVEIVVENEMLADIVGATLVLPGFVTRRSISVPNVALSTPMKYPIADTPVFSGSGLSTPRAEKGPAPTGLATRFWKTQTVAGLAVSSGAFGMT